MSYEVFSAEDYYEYFRIYSIYEVTEEGSFKEDSVPDTLASGIMRVKVVHRICFVSEGGQIEYYRYSNEEPMNEDKTFGGSVTIDGLVVGTSGSGGEEWKWYTVYNPSLPPDVAAKAEVISNKMFSRDGILTGSDLLKARY